MTNRSLKTCYDFHIPVYKQGDDLNSHIEANNGSARDAFMGLAGQYEEAAKLCRQMASIAAEEPAMTVEADCHCCWVSGISPDRAEALLADEVIQSQDWMGDEEDPGMDDDLLDALDDEQDEQE